MWGFVFSVSILNASIKKEARIIVAGLNQIVYWPGLQSTALLNQQLQAIQVNFDKVLQLLDGSITQTQEPQNHRQGLLKIAERDFNPEIYTWKKKQNLEN